MSETRPPTRHIATRQIVAVRGEGLEVRDDRIVGEAPLEIRLRIANADGNELFAGETSTARMRRTFPELVEWLLRANPVPPGSVMLTGTGLVPPDGFTLEPGHVVEIHVPGIGTLTNPVVTAEELLTTIRSEINV